MSKFESSRVVKKFRENIRKIPDPESARFVCGVSGGIDSMTLLFLLHRHQISCTVVHCNYRLRGEESDKDRDLVEQVSAMWDFECITATFDPAEAKNRNTQAWARDKRYGVFRDIREQTGADYILTAHHQTDQVETILQKILRGSGLEAWKGIGLKQGNLLRPLLGISKQQIKDFAEEYHVPFREDATNESAGYARNFLRHTLTPEMDHFFPGWRENVLKIPVRSEEFSQMRDHLFEKILTRKKHISRSELLKLPRTLWPVMIHHFLKTQMPETSLSEGMLKRFLSVDDLQTGAGIELNSGWKIVRDRNRLLLVEKESYKKNMEIQFSREELSGGRTVNSFRLNISDWKGKIEDDKLQLDADKLSWPVRVRFWQQGDRIQCLGMEGSKSIADLLTDKKISATQKKEAILIESFDEISSAVIFPHTTADGQPGIISEHVKCSSETKQILQIDSDL